MRATVLIALVTLVTAPVAADNTPKSSAPNVSGFYACEGKSPEGQAYKGTVEIVQLKDTYRIRWSIDSRQGVMRVVGVGIFNADGTCCYGTNTYLEELVPESIAGDSEAIFAIDALELVEGTYKVDVAIHKIDGYPYDYHRLLYTFRVKSRTKDVGIYRPEHQWQFTPNIQFKNDERRTKN